MDIPGIGKATVDEPIKEDHQRVDRMLTLNKERMHGLLAPRTSRGGGPDGSRRSARRRRSRRTINRIAELPRTRDISKRFGGVRALRDIDFDVAAGEVHCLAGENGSGKSTLIKIISGVQPPEPAATS